MEKEIELYNKKDEELWGVKKVRVKKVIYKIY